MMNPGDKMEDGTVYVGKNPLTGDWLFVPERVVAIRLRWLQAVEHTRSMNVGEHTDWRLPTEQEMDVVFESREKGALKKIFKNPACGYNGYDADDDIYWTANWKLDQPQLKETKNINTGATAYRYKETRLAVLPIRSGPAPA